MLKIHGMRRQTNQGPNVRQVFRRLVGYLGAVRGKFILSLAFMAVSSSLTAAKAWIVQPTVDTFLEGPTENAQLRILCAIVLAIFVLQAVFNWLFVVFARVVSADVTRRIRSELFSHLQRQSLGYFTNVRSSDLMGRVIADVSVFESSALGALQGFIRNGMTLALLLGVMLMQQLQWGLIWFAVMVVTGFVLRSMGRRIITVARGAQDKLSRLAHHLSEITAGIAVIIGFGVKDHWQKQFAESNQNYCEMQVKTTHIRSLAAALLEALTGVTLAGILLWMGSAVLDGDLTAGQLLSFLAVMFLVQAPAQRMTQCVAGLSQGFAAGERAFEIFDQKPEICDPQNPRALPMDGGQVEFRNVSFSYDDHCVIKDLSFVIRSKEFVVLAGQSGSGKSTVTKLAQRFYDPDRGQLLINGIDVREVRRQDLCTAVSYVAQDVFLFDETIRFNIEIGNPDATQAELDEVIRVACLAEVIDELPNGLQSSVGERGERLSGGQRQRIGIARALLMNSRILILDEATSALDMDLERRLFNNLAAVRRTRTILAITHRLTMAGIADRVLVLRDGRLVEEGSSADLGAADGGFSRLQSQACI